MWWYLGILVTVIIVLGTIIVEYENRLIDSFNSIEIGSKWIMAVDQSGWPLPEYTGTVIVEDKGSDGSNLIIYCSTDDGRLLRYQLEDFLKGKRI